MAHLRGLSVVAGLVLALGACAPGAQETGGGPGALAQGGGAHRTLVIGLNVEPTTVASRPPTTTGSTPDAPVLIFNGWLVVTDGHNVPRPQLAEKLPDLNSADWQVFSDGTMETTYRLKAGTSWHDGTPLTAQDFAFGFKVWTWKDMAVPTDLPIKLMQAVTAPDERTVVIKWSQPYPDAGAIGTTRYGSLPPMPRHLLEARFNRGDVQSFLNDPWWTNDFVGSGPYQLERWEPGSFIQGSGFAGFVDGPPKINQIKMVFFGDPNTAVASLLAGDTHLIGEGSIGFEQGNLLKKQWEVAGAGVVLLTPNKTRFIQIQFKPDYVNPKAILDHRVRRAFLEATDRAALSAGILDGQVAVADTLAGPMEEYFSQLDRVGTKYPFNLQNAAGLMGDAGFRRGADGFYADPSGQRLSLELRAFSVDPGPREAAVLADQWKQFGANINIHVIAAAEAQNLESVSAYSAFRIEQTGFAGVAVGKLLSSSIATAANRWAGVNRGGWSNPGYDRFMNAFTTSLDRSERNQAVVQGFKIMSDELPVLPLYYLPLASAYASTLHGPTSGFTSDTAWDNVAQWEWTR